MPALDHILRLRHAAIFVALAALLVVVPAAVAAATPTQLSAKVTPAVVTYPGQAVVAGTIIGIPGAELTLETRPAGGAGVWSPAGAATASSSGAFRFELAPSVSSDLRVSYAGALPQHDAASVELHLVVSARVTISSPKEPWLGHIVRLSGAVAPAHPGAPVTIQRREDGVWQSLATTTLGDDARFLVRWQPTEAGRYRLRARMEADADHGVSASPTMLVIVNQPNPHHVLYKYAHYIVIVRHEFRLYYYEHGTLVRGFNVALGRPGYRTPLGHFRIYGKRKPAGGALGACAMYYRARGAIAIHGTDEPWLIRRRPPRDFSHGCARMLNRQVLWLYARVPVGTRVHNLP